MTGLAFISPVILLIKDHYNVSSNEVQLTITIYLVAICISQVFWGPLSDLIGRRIVLIIGASLFSLGGILASLNLAFDPTDSPKFINEVHQAAWRLGIKTLYYLRTDSVINGDIGSRTALDCLSCDG